MMNVSVRTRMDLERKSILLMLAFLQFFSGTAGSLKTYGVQDLCRRTLTLEKPGWGLGSSIILKPKESGSFQANRNCSLVVENLFSFGVYLVVSVRTIDLRPSGADTLTIRYEKGGNYRNEVYVNNHLSQNRQHDSEERKSFESHDDVTITFNTSAKSSFNTSNFEGFELTITSIELGMLCHGSLFQCRSGPRCISSKLRCDGHNHCGDRSDQEGCGGDTADDTRGDWSNDDRSSYSDSSSPFVIGVCVVLGLLFLGLLTWCCRNNDCEGSSTNSTTYSSSSRPGIYAIGSVNSYSRSSSGSSDRCTGGSASGGYSAYESSYSGGSASGGYSAYESNYAGSSAAGGYSASESTYEGSSAAGCTSAY